MTQECADEAVKEIVRCKEADGEFGDRWISVMLAPDALYPAGNHRYWPIATPLRHREPSSPAPASASTEARIHEIVRGDRRDGVRYSVQPLGAV